MPISSDWHKMKKEKWLKSLANCQWQRTVSNLDSQILKLWLVKILKIDYQIKLFSFI